MGKLSIDIVSSIFVSSPSILDFRFIGRKGQALQFNWLYEKEAFILNPDETFSVNFDKVQH